MGDVRKTSGASKPKYRGKNNHQHWYRDHQVYFLVGRCRARFPALASDEAKSIFWQQLDRYATRYGFELWIASLLVNHYRVLGYLNRGEDLPRMMQGVHGATAKLANDQLESRRVRCPEPTFERTKILNRLKRNSGASEINPSRLVPFWRESKCKNYFDGLLRNTTQLRRAWRYTWIQCRRHGVDDDPARYKHTRVWVGVDECIRLADERNALL